MKTACITLLSLLLLSISFSCTKDKAPVKGQWRWAYSNAGGFAGGIITPSPDTVVSLALEDNLTYTTYLNNKTNGQGTYYYTSVDNVTTIHFDKAIAIDKMFLHQEELLYKTGSDTLSFLDNQIEGASAIFVRIK